MNTFSEVVSEGSPRGLCPPGSTSGDHGHDNVEKERCENFDYKVVFSKGRRYVYSRNWGIFRLFETCFPYLWPNISHCSDWTLWRKVEVTVGEEVQPVASVAIRTRGWYETGSDTVDVFRSVTPEDTPGTWTVVEARVRLPEDESDVGVAYETSILLVSLTSTRSETDRRLETLI